MRPEMLSTSSYRSRARLKSGTGSRAEVVPLPPAAKKLPFNKGLEALVMVPKGMALGGTLIALSERGLRHLAVTSRSNRISLRGDASSLSKFCGPIG